MSHSNVFPPPELLELMDSSPERPVTACITVWLDGEMQVEAWHRTTDGARHIATGKGNTLHEAIIDAVREGWSVEIADGDSESVVIEDAADRLERYREIAIGLDVEVVVVGADLQVTGAHLYLFLERVDPDTWSAERSQGDA